MSAATSLKNDSETVRESVAAPRTESTETDGKLSNKELKERKKLEKAAKRSARKQANGITPELQQQQAEAKKAKKQKQREKQQSARENTGAKANVSTRQKKSTLFGHLETTEQRRATILALSSAISSPKASRVTAAGLMVPVIATALAVPGSEGSITSSEATPGNSALISGGATAIAGTATTDDPALEMAKSLVNLSLESQRSSVVPGITSVIPNTMEKSLQEAPLLPSIKELLINKDLIHPAISLLTSHVASYKIVGSIPRCIAMLEAFQIVIRDYKTPKGTTLSRNLTHYLSHQIDILKKSRPLSVTMGNSIRWLKQEISLIDPTTPDLEAKEALCDKIAQFAREKIDFADQLIIEDASKHITNNTTILTYGSSKVITELILHNSVDLQKAIQVIVVDSRPLFEGRKMAHTLREQGVNVTYSLINSLDTVFNMGVDYVFLSAHSILSNGFLYSRSGTAMIAMSAKRRNIPVLVCCESLKFSQRVQLDSVTYNELADPNDLVPVDYETPAERNGSNTVLLRRFVRERQAEKQMLELQNVPKNKQQQKRQSANNTSPTDSSNIKNDSTDKNILDGWQNHPHLNIVNILYDLTPPEYIQKVITEFGALPPSSVPVILREYKSSA